MTSELSGLLTDVVVIANRMARFAATVTGEKTSPSHYRVLSELSEHGTLRVGELAEKNRVSQPTMTRLIDSLAEGGWVSRVADPDDGRVWRIAIAVSGQHALDGWRKRIGDALEPYFAGLTPEDGAALRRTIEILRSGLAADRKHPTP